METIYATFPLISQGLCSILNCKNVDLMIFTDSLSFIYYGSFTSLWTKSCHLLLTIHPKQKHRKYTEIWPDMRLCKHIKNCFAIKWVTVAKDDHFYKVDLLEGTDHWLSLLAATASLIYTQSDAICRGNNALHRFIHALLHTSTTSSAYLHVVEDSWFLKVELNIHAALPEGFPAPAQVVIPRPHPQLLSLCKVISSQDTVTQLTKPSKLYPATNQQQVAVAKEVVQSVEVSSGTYCIATEPQIGFCAHKRLKEKKRERISV